ncbi:glycosyltransferase family 9 protein [Pontibacter pudoricolor]|uniref:glycosyltransferase family 9 protein n=1 Tax=Pontibacter pudoricolor TaxID=2694930 RepID=UPI001391C7F8|nr:glycosyltransferase family 9 protein [Pontibacter pudoricolor]
MLAKIKKSIWYLIFLIVRKIVLPFNSNRILIVRLDAIGDYILFRNYLHFLKNQPQYKNRTITLLGNSSVRTLSESYDFSVIDHFIWINPSLLYHNHLKKFKLLLKLKLKSYDLIINPMHSRRWEFDEFISSIGGKKVIGSEGDSINFETFEKYKRSSKFYDKLIKVSDTDEFEFNRNREFFEKLTGSSEQMPILSLPVDFKREDQVITIVIVPGAGEAFRRWSALYFALTVNSIQDQINSSIKFVITGSKSEKFIAENIIKNINQNVKVLDLTGLLDLPQLINIIASADLLISNETSAVHIAAATASSAICVSHGRYRGRFHPYPKDLATNIINVYPKEGFEKDELANFRQINREAVDIVVNKALELLI